MASGLYGFTPNVPGIDAVLSSGAVRGMLASIAAGIAGTANAIAQEDGAEYQSHVDMATYVPLGKVTCGNHAARKDNALHNTLLKAR